MPTPPLSIFEPQFRAIQDEFASRGLTAGVVRRFRNLVKKFHAEHGRASLPWRRANTTAYEIMVSEIMLQQTQVDRVVEKFIRFLAHFPRVEDLAAAKQSEVLRLWSGLGYNRRALNLQKAAQKIVADFGGELPQDLAELISLPGIGPYTAAAIRAFAWNLANLVIETNIRAVYLHAFFPDREKVPDSELLPLIEKTMPASNARNFYSGLMDLGSWLKSVLPNPSRRSRHHARQSKFEGSLRQIRGAILKSLHASGSTSQAALAKLFPDRIEQIQQALNQLQAEGFIKKSGRKFELQ